MHGETRISIIASSKEYLKQLSAREKRLRTFAIEQMAKEKALKRVLSKFPEAAMELDKELGNSANLLVLHERQQLEADLESQLESLSGENGGGSEHIKVDPLSSGLNTSTSSSTLPTRFIPDRTMDNSPNYLESRSRANYVPLPAMGANLATNRPIYRPAFEQQRPSLLMQRREALAQSRDYGSWGYPSDASQQQPNYGSGQSYPPTDGIDYGYGYGYGAQQGYYPQSSAHHGWQQLAPGHDPRSQNGPSRYW